jgi:hypothetical protein
MTTLGRSTMQGKSQLILKGIQQELQLIATLPLAGETYTPQTLADFVQGHIDLGNEIDVAKAAWLDKVAEHEAMSKKMRVVSSDLRNVVMASFGRKTPKLATFGFAPFKTPVLTSEQRALATAKAQATRKARRTMGPKQKAKIKGVVETAPPEVVEAAEAAPVVATHDAG